MIAYFCLISCTQQQQQERVSNTFHSIWLILCSDRLPFHKFMIKICSSVIIILFFLVRSLGIHSKMLAKYMNERKNEEKFNLYHWKRCNPFANPYAKDHMLRHCGEKLYSNYVVVAYSKMRVRKRWLDEFRIRSECRTERGRGECIMCQNVVAETIPSIADCVEHRHR